MQGGIKLPEGLYSIKETAALTHMSESSLRRLDNSGKLRAKRVQFGKSKYRVYFKEDIEVLKAIRSDDLESRKTWLIAELQDVVGQINEWDVGYTEQKEDTVVENKTFTLFFKYESIEVKKLIRDIFVSNQVASDPKRK